MRKIDRDWTDMLWQYHDSGSSSEEDAITDDEFLRYFRFICDVLCYQRGGSPQKKSPDEFDLLTEYFTGDKTDVLHSIETMESYFDCWCRIDGYSRPSDFLNSCMSNTHEEQKIIVNNKIDIFEDCLHSYTDKSGRERLFPPYRIILLYAVTSYLRNSASIKKSDFTRRLRCINNLIQNSKDEIIDRTDGNRIPAILQQVDAIMTDGNIDDTIKNSFNINQITEEKEKKDFLEKFPDKAPVVFALEDHPYLKGQISIVGLDHLDYADRFASLFSCDPDLIDCALMSIEDYSQLEQNKWRYQFASRSMQTAWDRLFHKSANTGFDNTSAILIKLLSKAESFTNEFLARIIENYIKSCEKSNTYPWRYYYIKYSSFRPGRYGKYSNTNKKQEPYMFCVMDTEQRETKDSYMPYLKEADELHLSRDFKGRRLVYGDRHIICQNNGYLLRDNETEEIIESITIPQNEEGIDKEDRVLRLKRCISKFTTETESNRQTE